MTDQKPQQLDLRSVQNLPREETGFFYRGPVEEVAQGILFAPSLGNATAFVCDGRLLMVDTTVQPLARRTLAELRTHTAAPIEAIVYTHGHIDHVTGAQAMIEEAQSQGAHRPRVIAHKAVAARFDRYQMLAAQNDHINRIQFSLEEDAKPFSSAVWTYPDTTYDQGLTISVGGEVFELRHCRGETDDETWVWCPGRRALCTGDTFVWCTPNAGNPYKVQRYAREWALALEEMASLRPALLLPGHGPAISGDDRIQEALLSTAHFLRSIHDQVVALMNEGKWLEDILREIQYPPTDKPWLRPIYDRPEFIARNVYRLYGGWYDGNPANMLPSHPDEIAAVIVAVAGADNLLARARRLRDEGDLQMACHITDFVRRGDPQNAEGWELWRDLFTARAAEETSLMARGAFRSAVKEAEKRLKELRD